MEKVFINTNKIIIIGFGNIGQALLPILSKYFQTYDLHIFEKNTIPRFSIIRSESCK